jgi:hypothetical protein
MMRHPSGLFLLALLFLLGGCASFSPPDRPNDFPLHQIDHPFFDLHWRLDRGDGVVSAVGLVEGTRQGDISRVYLELRGLDKEGREVSRGLGRTLAGRLYRWDTLPFFVSLRPTGQEERFELSVWSYDWATDNGNGRD